MKLVSNLKIQIENANETQNVIKKCRYSNDHKILRGGKMASRIVLMQIKDCFAELKEYVNMKRFWNMNKKMSQLIDVLSKSYQRINVIHKSKAFKEFLYCNKLVEELGIIRKIKNAEVVLEALKKKIKKLYFSVFFIIKNKVKDRKNKQNIIKSLAILLTSKITEYWDFSIQKLKLHQENVKKISLALLKVNSIIQKIIKKESFFMIREIHLSSQTKSFAITHLFHLFNKKNIRSQVFKYFDD